MAAAPNRYTTSAPVSAFRGNCPQKPPMYFRRVPAYKQPIPATNILEELLKEYIDSSAVYSASYKLKQQLQQSSAESKYEILKRVRGEKYTTDSSVYTAAYICDLEGLKAMLGGLTPEQKFDLASPIGGYTDTALHHAVYYEKDAETHGSPIEILKYLLDSLSTDQSYDLLKVGDRSGYTVLHYIMTHDMQQFLSDCCTTDQQERLLSLRNKNGASLADVSMPVLYETVQGLEETNKALADVQMTSDGQVRKLNETNLQLREDKEELRQELNGTYKALADLQKSSNRQVQDMKQQTQELKQTKKVLEDLQTTKEKLQKAILQMQQSMSQQSEELELTKKVLVDLETTSYVEKEELHKAILLMQQNMTQQTAALQATRDELDIVRVSSQGQIDGLQEKNCEQEQVIQVMSARQAAMEQMLERLELEFRRPIVTDETGDQELEELDE